MGRPGVPGTSGARACADVDEEVDEEVASVLNGLLDKIAQRTPREKRYLAKRCTHVDEQGTRCANWGPGRKPNLCVAHGGKHVCRAPGCDALVTGTFCPTHRGNPCTFPGCTNKVQHSNGYCHSHNKATKPVGPDDPDYEVVHQLKRDRALRAKWLFPLLAQQGFRCARAIATCEAVDGGGATPACPWGERQLPLDAADVYHDQPVCEDGSANRTLMQVFCKCCHGLKLAAEARTRVAKRKLEA